MTRREKRQNLVSRLIKKRRDHIMKFCGPLIWLHFGDCDLPKCRNVKEILIRPMVTASGHMGLIKCILGTCIQLLLSSNKLRECSFQ
jgi:hypothetical protein